MMKDMAADVSQVGLSSIHTRKSNFLWKISNFSCLKNNLERLCGYVSSENIEFTSIIESPKFFTDGDDYQWSLVIFTAKECTGYPFLCFKLKIHDHSKKYFTINVQLSISILKSNGEKFTKEKHCLIISDSCLITTEQIYDLPSFKREDNEYFFRYLDLHSLFDKSNNYLINDELHVLCEYELTSDHKNNQILYFKSDSSINHSIIKTLEKQWIDQNLCDFDFIAPCGKRIGAHKLILIARSPVFNRMLFSNMQEKHENSIKIEDISYEALQEMLRFMYSGKVKELDKYVVGVLAAAEKYQIGDLKNVCKKFLLDDLKVDSAVKTLKLCKMYEMSDIQPLVEAFIKSNVHLIYSHSDETEMLEIIQLRADKYKLN